MLAGERMRDSNRELTAARNLHAWLRRVALSAIPIAGLAGCASRCSDYDTSVQVDGGVSWAPGSGHSPAECVPYCGSGMGDPYCYRVEITGSPASPSSSVPCHNAVTLCEESPCGRMPAGWRPGTLQQQPSAVA